MAKETLEQMIERHEGCRDRYYLDSEGVPTIGIGHNLFKPISRAAIEQIFRDDLREAWDDCLHAFPWFADLTEPRQWAMIDLCFNLGMTRLLGFRKFLTAMNLGEYETAANELMDSLWFKQVKNRGVEVVSMIRGSAET